MGKVIDINRIPVEIQEEILHLRVENHIYLAAGEDWRRMAEIMWAELPDDAKQALRTQHTEFPDLFETLGD